MVSRESRICSICHQTKPLQDFPKIVQGGRLLAKNPVCLLCRKSPPSRDTDADDSSGGGKQQTRDAKHLQQEIEISVERQKALRSLNSLEADKILLRAVETKVKDLKAQLAQRELLEEKEKDNQNTETENPDLTENTKFKREKVTRLFSVTRQLARQHNSANNTRAQSQNFSLFSATNVKQKTINLQENQKTQRTNAANKTFSTESATLFAHSAPTENPVTDEAERLSALIREAQKIFTR